MPCEVPLSVPQDLFLKSGQPPYNRLALSSPACLKNSHETPLHLIRSRPLLQVGALDLLADVEIDQRGKRNLERRQEVVRVERHLRSIQASCDEGLTHLVSEPSYCGLCDTVSGHQLPDNWFLQDLIQGRLPVGRE